MINKFQRYCRYSTRGLTEGTERFLRWSSGEDGDAVSEESPLTRMLGGGRLAALFRLGFCTLPGAGAGLFPKRAVVDRVRGKL